MAKKKVSEELTIPKAYDPSAVEKELYALWHEKGYFKPKKAKSGSQFSIVIPPPNVTGELHAGHAVFVAVQDSLIRYHRMKGDETVWIPGFDHAGIATQVVVEKEIAKKGKTRHDFTREEFEAQVWEWVERHRERIRGQLQSMGASMDWSRERFTLDDDYQKAVERVFVDMYRKGLIYRDDYIVNWCSESGTVLSDLEVETEERENKLYFIRYFVKAADKSMMVATTRPETLLGDVAVAVHPDDKRYKELHDKMLILPILNKEIPIITDERVDMNFGSGAVKITPAHDAFDYEVAKDHKLPVISVIGKDGKMNKNAGKYAGLEVAQARANIIEYLDNIGNLEKVEKTVSSFKKCERTGGDVEPLVMKQWFVKTEKLAKMSMDAVEKEQTMIIPERFEKEFAHWMNNMRDWCISRQLWWGHRIPAWFRDDEVHVGLRGPKGDGWEQDTDVLDTWFSSALWPFVVFGWPENTTDFKKFFPTSVLETGRDILFFWVARMMMMSLQLTKEVPFKYVYLHGLVRDEQHQKFSKSKGNGFAPEVIQEEYGTDAMRLLLMLGNTPGNDMIVSKEKAQGYRNFVNKIWNASRFIRMQGKSTGNYEDIEKKLRKSYKKLNFAQKWILSRLNSVVDEVSNGFEQFAFGEAGSRLYEFTWNEFCDWYLEISKFEENKFTQMVLEYSLLTLLKLWHPYVPFVTEEIWKNFDQKDHLIVSKWPEIHKEFTQEEAEKDFELLIDMVKTIRNIRHEKGVEPGKSIPVYIYAEEKHDLVENFTGVMKKLARLSQVKVYKRRPDVDRKISVVMYPFEIIMPLDEMIDVKKERARIEAELKDVEKTLRMLSAKLDNKAFIDNAPKEVVAMQRKRLHETEETAERLRAHVAELK